MIKLVLSAYYPMLSSINDVPEAAVPIIQSREPLLSRKSHQDEESLFYEESDLSLMEAIALLNDLKRAGFDCAIVPNPYL